MNKSIIKRILDSSLSALALSAILVSSTPVSAQSKGSARELQLRVASYNIQRGEGMDGKLNYPRTAGVLTGINAEVVAVQEVDSMTHRTSNTYSLGAIADVMHYHATYAPTINYDGGKYGIGILSRQQPLRTSQYPLPGKDEARTILVAEFADYVFACTHLSLDEAERMQSLPIIEDIAKSYDKPFILAGDWNAHPDSPFVKALQESFTICSSNSLSWPSDTPTECLDYIAVYKNSVRRVQSKNATVVDTQASDHRPIYTDIKIRQR